MRGLWKEDLVMTTEQRLALAFICIAWAAIFGLSGCNTGCGPGSGSCIGIGEPQPEPTCAELVTDECVDEVVAEFCPDAEVVTVEVPVDGPTHCVLEGDLCWRGQYLNGAWKYVQYPCDLQPTPECPDVDVVEPDEGEDTCDLTVPVGHRPIECRGKGHAALDCTEICRFTPNGSRICETHCNTRTA